jgi:hypothetical protein
MRSRLYLFALAAAFALAAPAFAQSGHTFDPGGVTGQTPAHSGTVTARVFTTAILSDAAGNPIGKVKTATVQTTDRGIVEGLRVQVTGLTPSTEFALVIDGTLVGTATSSSTGVLRLKFLAPSNGRVPAIPDAVRPIARASTVQLYDTGTQRLVASGTFRGGVS